LLHVERDSDAGSGYSGTLVEWGKYRGVRSGVEDVSVLHMRVQ
jgi:hypothetical protein